MSLKALHIAFLVLSTTLALGFAIWATVQFNEHGTPFYVIAAAISYASAVALPIYGARFLRKIRSLARS